MALLVLLFIVFLPKIEGQFREIDSCPLSIYEWKRREALFQCPPDTNYHCILMYNTSQLYEACMVAGTIQPGKVGCPWILFNEDIPILGSKNSECPVTNPNCPPSDHRGFLTNQLYQYPACFIHRSARTSKIIDLITRIPSTTSKRGHLPPSSENTSDQNFGTWIVVLIVFTVGAIIAGLIAYVLRRKIKEKCMSQQSRQFSKDDIKYEKERFMTDGETVTPRVEDVQVTFHPNNHHIDVKQSNDDVTRTNPHQLHQIEVKQSRDRVEDAQSTSPSLQQQSDDKHQEHDVTRTTPNQQHQIEVKQSRDRVEDAKSTSPSLQQQSDVKHQEHDVQVTFHPNNHHIDVKQSNDDVTRTTPHQQHQIEVKQSRDRVEDAKSTSPSLQHQSDVKHQEHDIKMQQLDPELDPEKINSQGDLSDCKHVLKFSEDKVRAVISTILTLPDGIAPFYHLLTLLLENKMFFGLTSQSLEELLRCNSTSFRLLEDSNGILFVIVYSSVAKICKTYNLPWLAGKCPIADCMEFHLCLYNLKGKCTRENCKFSHNYGNAHNRQLKQMLHLNGYSDDEMNIILLNQYPKLCSAKDCKGGNSCFYLHICHRFCFGKCNDESRCPYEHSFNTEHNRWILGAYGIQVEKVWDISDSTRCFSIAKNHKRTKKE